MKLRASFLAEKPFLFPNLSLLSMQLLPRKGACFCSPPGVWQCSFKGIAVNRKMQNLNKDPLIIQIYLAAYQPFEGTPQQLAGYLYIYELRRPVIPSQAARTAPATSANLWFSPIRGTRESTGQHNKNAIQEMTDYRVAGNKPNFSYPCLISVFPAIEKCILEMLNAWER